jgi:succinoglycan biosynthesis transport protein ExoP
VPAERNGPRGRSLRARAEQLEILASLQTGNAELVQRAQVPEARSSPRISRNLVLGLVLGGLIGVIFALLAERLDQRVRNPEEIEAAFDRPKLGAIPVSSALGHDGASASALPPHEREAFRMLRTNLRYFNVDRGLQSVLVTSAVPAEGKSTIAWNLAVAAAEAGERVLLIEADLRRPRFGGRPGATLFRGLCTVLVGQASLAEVTQRVPLASEADPRALYLVSAGPLPPNPAELLESERARQLIRSADQRYDLVVIDTPPTSVVSDAIPLMTEVDGVIVVARLGTTTREGMLQLRDHLANLGASTLGVVINGAARESSGYRYYGYYGGRRVTAVADASSGGSDESSPRPGSRHDSHAARSRG